MNVLFLVDGKVGMYFGDNNILGDFKKLKDFERDATDVKWMTPLR